MATRVGEIGYWSGLTATGFTVAYVVVQVLQILGAVTFPLDEILIYGTSLGITVPFLLTILALHHVTGAAERFWTHAAVIFAVIYSVFVIANYVVQLATVIPAKLAGALDSVGHLDQTPHSMFWNYDAVGYIAMGFVALLAIPAFGRTGVERWVRVALIAHVLVTPLIGVVYFYPAYSTTLLFLGFPWGITAPLFMFLMAVALRRRTPGDG